METRAKNNKRPRNSPETDQRKHITMESNVNSTQNNENNDSQAANLPPELKLLYVSLTKMMEKMQPIENDMKTLLKDRDFYWNRFKKFRILNTTQIN